MRTGKTIALTIQTFVVKVMSLLFSMLSRFVITFIPKKPASAIILNENQHTSPSSQSYGFPVVMYGYESWTIKKAEHQRTDAFELEKTLESPLDCKEIKPVNPKNQS